MKFFRGKHKPRIDDRTLLFAKYGTALAAPPSLCDWASAVSLWNMLGNDFCGDCVPALLAHQITAWTKNELGKGLHISLPQVLSFYSALSGYNRRTGRHDTGVVMLDAMNRWRKTGIGGRKIGAYTAITPTNVSEVRNAIYLFGGCQIGFTAKSSVFSIIQNQTTWDVPSGQQNGADEGHGVALLGYNATVSPVLYTVSSWGEIYYMTENFLTTYCDEGYCALSPRDWVKNGPSPSGFDLATLRTDLTALTA